VHVVATFSILRDLVRQVGGDRLHVEGLVGANADAHSYQGRPQDVRAVAQAQVVVSNGLGFEAWLPRLLEAAKFGGRHAVASDGVEPLYVRAHGVETRVPDPHCWQDVTGARRYVANIVAALTQVEALDARVIRSRASDFDARLATLDDWVKDQIRAVPEGRRKVITDHDAFEYFARAYGVQFVSVRKVTPETEATAKHVASLVAMVREHRVRALFMENMTNPALIAQIAGDAGGFLGDTLYSDALSSPDGPAATYEAMMRHNVTALVAGMLRN
jgi:zinc/manganese transport system substrate-binding protein